MRWSRRLVLALAVLLALVPGWLVLRPRHPWPDRWQFQVSRSGVRVQHITSMDVNIWPRGTRLPVAGIEVATQVFRGPGRALWSLFVTLPPWLVPLIVLALIGGVGYFSAYFAIISIKAWKSTGFDR